MSDNVSSKAETEGSGQAGETQTKSQTYLVPNYFL